MALQFLYHKHHIVAVATVTMVTAVTIYRLLMKNAATGVSEQSFSRDATFKFSGMLQNMEIYQEDICLICVNLFDFHLYVQVLYSSWNTRQFFLSCQKYEEAS